MFQAKNILVTGSAGFIGSNFVHYFLRAIPSATIVSLDKLTYAGDVKNLENLPDQSRHVFVQGDICDVSLVTEVLRKHTIDTIVHFAAESHVDRSITGPMTFVQTNVLGTGVLLDVARKYWLEEKKWDQSKCRFHHISTDEVYGELKLNDAAFNENNAYTPSSPYSASKAASDHLVRAYYRTYKLPATISNCSNNYGPRQHPEKLIPTIIRSCFAQKPIPVYGDGSNIRDWLFVEDHCRAIHAILERGRVGETYNIGGNCEKNNLTLVKTICTIMDQRNPSSKPHERLITFVPDRPGHDWRYAIDAQKMLRELAWQPQVSLLTGLQQTIDYYQAR